MLLGEKAVNGKEIAQHPYGASGALQIRGNIRGRGGPVIDDCEQIQVDRALQRGATLDEDS